MALTFWRWIAVAAVGCLVAGTVASRPRLRPERELDPRERLARTLSDAGRAATLATDRLRVTQLRDSVMQALAERPTGDTSRWIVARDLPSWINPSLNALRQRAATARPERAVRPIDVVFLNDTSSLVRGVPHGRKNRIEVDYALPPTANDRCAVLVRIRFTLDTARSRSHFTRYLSSVTSGAHLAGPCGFYEWFGNPGPGVDRWLRGGGWAFGRIAGHWERSVTPVDFWGYWRSYTGFGASDAGWPLRDFVSPRGYRCFAWDEHACANLLLATSRPPELHHVWDSSFVSPGRMDDFWRWRRMYQLGPEESRIVASFVHQLGPDRFRQFWQAPGTADEAFRAAAGVSIGAAVHAWSNEVYGEAKRGPGVGGATLAGSALIGFAAIGLAIRSARRRRST